MGCFNVACSVSNISIGWGEEVAFICMRAKKDYTDRTKNERLFNTSSFHGTTALYEPAFLPVFGKYNDYGGVEDIVKDNNTAFLESKYGISIETMIDFVCNHDRGVEGIAQLLPHSNLKNFDYSHKIDEANLLNCNFSKLVENVYSLNDTDLTLFIGSEDDGGYFEVSRNDIIKKYGQHTGMKDLQRKIFEDFGIIISLSRQEEKEALAMYSFFSELSGMFVHKDIFDMMVAGNLSGVRNVGDNMDSEPVKLLLEKLGFVEKEVVGNDTFYEKEGFKVSIPEYGRGCRIGKDEVYYMSEFFDKVPLDLDKSLIENVDAPFEKYLIMLNPLEDRPSNVDDPNYEIDMLRWKMDKNRDKDKLGFRDMYQFSELYFDKYGEEEIILGKNLFDFKRFIAAMYGMNRYFSPAMNGEQDGNVHLSRMLFEKSLSILNSKSVDEDYNVIIDYIQNRNVSQAASIILECLEDYDIEEAVDMIGLSRYELNTFLKDNSTLADILDSYCV